MKVRLKGQEVDISVATARQLRQLLADIETARCETVAHLQRYEALAAPGEHVAAEVERLHREKRFLCEAKRSAQARSRLLLLQQDEVARAANAERRVRHEREMKLALERRRLRAAQGQLSDVDRRDPEVLLARCVTMLTRWKPILTREERAVFDTAQTYFHHYARLSPAERERLDAQGDCP